MKIALVQMKANVIDLQENYNVVLSFLDKAIHNHVDLICFPEMALCGYSFDHVPLREQQQHQYIKLLHKYSIDQQLTICIGGIEEEAGHYYISQFVIREHIEVYRKTHLGNKEKAVFSPGQEMPVFKQGHVTFAVMTCYDGHFPELALEYALKGVSFILNPSAAPNSASKRITMWSKYLIARAYDNRIWVLATNLLLNERGGGLMVYNSDGENTMSYTGTDEHMEIVEVTFTNYSNSKRKLVFNDHRRDDLYGHH